MRCFIFLISTLFSTLSFGFHWQDLWLTPDQQAEKQMQLKNYKEAEALFQSEPWKATAAYRAKNYKEAAKLFNHLNNEMGFYNEGNASAYAHDYEAAIRAYDKALKLNPNNKQALENKKLVETLLKKSQKKQKNNETNNQNQQNQANSSKDNKNQQPSQNQQNNQPSTEPKKNEDQKSTKDEVKNQENKQDNTTQEKNDLSKENQKTQDEAKKQSAASREKQQIKEQWLRLIPDDPGGLLREKFLRDYHRRQRGENHAWQN